MHGVKYLTGWHHTGNDRERSGTIGNDRERLGTTGTTGNCTEGTVVRHVLILATVFVSFVPVAAQVGRDAKSPAAATKQHEDGQHQWRGRLCRSGTPRAAGHRHSVRQRRRPPHGAHGADRRRGHLYHRASAPGEYTLSANKGGFVESIYGQRQAGSGRLGTPITADRGTAAQGPQRASRPRWRPDRRGP